MLIQTGLAVGITTVMALLLSNDTISTMSSVWTWGHGDCGCCLGFVKSGGQCVEDHKSRPYTE